MHSVFKASDAKRSTLFCKSDVFINKQPTAIQQRESDAMLLLLIRVFQYLA